MPNPRVPYGTDAVVRRCQALLAVAALGYVVLCAVQGFWLDEVSTVMSGRLGFADMIAERAHIGQVPLYFVLSWTVQRLFGENEIVLRLPSILFSLLTAGILFRFVSRVMDRHIALTAVLLWLLYPQQVAIACQARPYTLAAFLGVTSTALLVRDDDRLGWRSASAIGVLALLSLFTHLAGLFVVGAQLAYLLVFRIRRGWRHLITLALSLAILALWCRLMNFGSATADRSLGWLRLFPWEAAAYLRSLDPGGIISTLADRFGPWCLIPAVAVSVGLVFWGTSRMGRQAIPVLWVWLGSWVLGVSAALAVRTPFMDMPRYFVTAMAMQAVLHASALGGFPERCRRVRSVAWTLYVGLCSLALVQFLCQGPLSVARPMARYILAHRASSDRVVLLSNSRLDTEPFRYYFAESAPTMDDLCPSSKRGAAGENAADRSLAELRSDVSVTGLWLVGVAGPQDPELDNLQARLGRRIAHLQIVRGLKEQLGYAVLAPAAQP